ncbi:MAG TPA: chromosome segregation protein SMC, partial [Enterovirga sp.]
SVSAEAERAAGRLETELRTLTKLFSSSGSGRKFATMLDQVEVARGYETAFGAALGDDLDASPDPAAPLAWLDNGAGEADPDLPAGAVPLANHVSGPAALVRRLRQIGVVERAKGAQLATLLAAGQRLVSREGDLWRWDGLRAAADAPSAAARRLVEKNRMAALAAEAGEARRIANAKRTDTAATEARLREAAAAESAAIEAARLARRSEGEARDKLQRAERRRAESGAKLAAIRDAMAQAEAGEREAASRLADAETGLAGLAPDPGRDTALLEARATLAEHRVTAAEARGAVTALAREAEIVARRHATLAAEIRSWTERAERAAGAARELDERLAAAFAEHAELAAAPDAFILRRRALTAQIGEAEAKRRDAADRLAEAETRLAGADKAARAALEALSSARERKAGSDARVEALTARLAETTRLIADTMDTDPVGLLQLAGLKPGEALPSSGQIEGRLADLKLDRERMGGVNLRAEDELAEAETKRDRLAGERDDLAEAIKRLRSAVSSLNREGRERLVAAFEIVNGHFGRLFTTLFGGGSAELALVDSDDPLEAGLEITAKPPGKRPQSLSLLSGGEQALTATALIFAVFLTNPSPICVLDEVDAPLDDANVERYCDLLHNMAGETETRFVVITHNPITMARMDRLFGVTMAERGISQLVSVDLEGAERMREAV